MNILKAWSDLNDAKANYRRVVEATQKTCSHNLVIQNPSSGTGDNYRICKACLLEEKGSHWSYTRTNWTASGDKTRLGNQPGRLVVQLAVGESFWLFRDPTKELT